jgi:hypothetical protein
VTANPQIDVKTAQTDGRAVSGVYSGSRRGESTLLKVAAVLGQVSVTADQNGILTIEGAQSPRGGLKRWREIGPMLYREVDGPDLIAFRVDANGVVAEMLPALPIQMAHRVTGLANKKILLPVVGASQGLLVLTLLLWPVAALVRRRYERALFATRGDRILYFGSRIVCLLEVLFVTLILLPLSLADKDIGLIGDGMNPWLVTGHVLGWLATAGLVLLAIAAVKFWRVPGLGWWTRVHASLLFLASAIFLAFAWWTHLLSPSLRF